jgi:hypothetical protein
LSSFSLICRSARRSGNRRVAPLGRRPIAGSRTRPDPQGLSQRRDRHRRRLSLESRAAAEAWFTEARIAELTQRFGVRPRLTWYDTHVTVDNLRGETRVNGVPLSIAGGVALRQRFSSGSISRNNTQRLCKRSSPTCRQIAATRPNKFASVKRKPSASRNAHLSLMRYARFSRNSTCAMQASAR